MKLSIFTEAFKGQVYSWDNGAEYSVPMLYAYAIKSMPIDEVAISKLTHNVFDNSPAFRRRAMEADLKYPILLHQIDGKLWIIDGAHRVFKAGEFKKSYVKAYIFIGNLPAKAQI
jgi:hypothetical protein